MRKCAILEAGGTSAHDALLASAGVPSDEIDALRGQVKQSEEKLKDKLQRELQLQRALDQATVTIARHHEELEEVRRRLHDSRKMEEAGRRTIAAFEAQVTELQSAIASCKEELKRTTPTGGLDEDALAAMIQFRDGLSRGDSVAFAAMAAAGYTPLDVDAAMAKQKRHEMRAFDALLARPSWRRRLVLWLIGAR